MHPCILSPPNLFNAGQNTYRPIFQPIIDMAFLEAGVFTDLDIRYSSVCYLFVDPRNIDLEIFRQSRFIKDKVPLIAIYNEIGSQGIHNVFNYSLNIMRLKLCLHNNPVTSSVRLSVLHNVNLCIRGNRISANVSFFQRTHFAGISSSMLSPKSSAE